MIRFGVLFLGVIIFSGGLIELYSRSLDDRRDIPETTRSAMEFISSKMEIWIVLVIDLIIPVWYMKMLVPIAIWIGGIIQYSRMEVEYKEVVWIKLVVATLYIICIFGAKALIQWKMFIKQIDHDRWYEVQNNMMNKIPDAIGVINSEYNVVSSNKSFRKLCHNNIKELGKRMIEIKRISPYTSTVHTLHERFSIEKEQIKMRTVIDETKQNFMNDDDKSHDLNQLGEKFDNLNDLLEEIMNNLEGGSLSVHDYMTFKGKFMNLQLPHEPLRTFEIKISPLAHYQKVTIILTDITQREKLISLEEVNQYKDKLLATVSHDLRAPINGTITFIENTIEDQSIPSDIKDKYLIPAQRSCRFLLHLVNDILDFSQINAQKLRMNFESLPIIETIRNCHELLEVQANHKKVLFKTEIDEKIPETFTTDHNRLSQIIINLLTNALKFTSRGEVTLSAILIDPSSIQIRIKDTGIGIKEEDQKKLFQEFTRIDYDHPDINTKGIGLGLVIANRLAMILGSDRSELSGIKVQSTYGKGSTFSFIIKDQSVVRDLSLIEHKRARMASVGKIAFDNNRNRSKTDIQFRSASAAVNKVKTGEYISFDHLSIIHTPPLTKFNVRNPNSQIMSSARPTYKDVGSRLTNINLTGRILIVDDDAFNILALESQLRKYGLTVESAYNGQEAIERLLTKRVNNSFNKSPKVHGGSSEILSSEEEAIGFDLIFMDCEMPIMDGFECSKNITKMMKNGQIDTIPIIGCTAHHTMNSALKCYESGMVEVITKPVSREKLKECLLGYLDMEV